jgi:hypothetical protein
MLCYLVFLIVPTFPKDKRDARVHHTENGTVEEYSCGTRLAFAKTVARLASCIMPMVWQAA